MINKAKYQWAFFMLEQGKLLPFFSSQRGGHCHGSSTAEREEEECWQGKKVNTVHHLASNNNHFYYILKSSEAIKLCNTYPHIDNGELTTYIYLSLIVIVFHGAHTGHTTVPSPHQAKLTTLFDSTFLVSRKVPSKQMTS